MLLGIVLVTLTKVSLSLSLPPAPLAWRGGERIAVCRCLNPLSHKELGLYLSSRCEDCAHLPIQT